MADNIALLIYSVKSDAFPKFKILKVERKEITRATKKTQLK